MQHPHQPYRNKIREAMDQHQEARVAKEPRVWLQKVGKNPVPGKETRQLQLVGRKDDYVTVLFKLIRLSAMDTVDISTVVGSLFHTENVKKATRFPEGTKFA
jgi:hypothetical protein